MQISNLFLIFCAQLELIISVRLEPKCKEKTTRWNDPPCTGFPCIFVWTVYEQVSESVPFTTGKCNTFLHTSFYLQWPFCLELCPLWFLCSDVLSTIYPPVFTDYSFLQCTFLLHQCIYPFYQCSFPSYQHPIPSHLCMHFLISPTYLPVTPIYQPIPSMYALSHFTNVPSCYTNILNHFTHVHTFPFHQLRMACNC